MFKHLVFITIAGIFLGATITPLVLPNASSAASDLVGYWSFDTATVIGTTAQDKSGNKNDGTINGAILSLSKTNCVVNECLQFNGSNNYITVPNNTSLNFGSGNFTLSLWLSTKITDNSTRFVIGKSETNAIGYNVFFPGGTAIGKIGISFKDSNQQSIIDTLTKLVNDGNWHQVTIVADKTQKKIFGYIDGESQKWNESQRFDLSFNIGSMDNTTSLLIASFAGPQNFFPGVLDEVKIYNRALSASEILQAFSEVSGGVGASCSSNSDCTDKPGGSEDLECRRAYQGKKCVPTPANRKIGTWCDAAEHCNTQEGVLKLTCNRDKNMCVGASSGISCAEDDVNKDPLLGAVNQDIEPFDRCDRNSLFCNSKFVCQADLGAAFAGQIAGVGQGTEDIRDTIRKIINIALGFLGVIGVLLVMYGGWTWMTAMGEEEKVEKAKKTIIAGVIGIAIIGVAWTIVSFVLSATQSAGGA